METQRIGDLPHDCILCGARVALGPSRTVRAAVLLRRGRIEAILPGYEPPSAFAKSARAIDVKGHLVLPGLVNAHDHLQFGMFPRLGHGPYSSWREWAADIYRPDEPPLRDLLEIPKDERLWWGIVRNLLAGVTTVCHHDESNALLRSEELPVSVHPRFGWAHSLDGREWKRRYAETPADWPFIVHCAEGLNTRSHREVGKIERAGKLDERMVLVHAVGIGKKDRVKLRAAGAWIVWCPTSNLHILGRTLARDLVLSYPKIALGSDSPISAAGDLLDELQAARSLFDMPADLLYQMVTGRAARLLRLSAAEGAVAEGGQANLLILRDTGRTPCESLASLERSDLAATMHRGEFTVVSEEFQRRLDENALRRLTPIDRHGLRWLIASPPAGLKLRGAQPSQETACNIPAELTKQ